MTDLQTTRPTEPRRDPRRRLVWLSLLLLASVAFAVFALVQLLSDPETPLDAAPDLSQLGSGGPQESDTAPDFAVPTTDGGQFVLADHLATDGRPVILNLWASWCFPCRAEMPAIDAAARAHPEVRFIGVAVQDDYQSASDFAAAIGVTYTIGVDEREQVDAEYPTLGLPATFFITSDGVIAHRVFGAVDEATLDRAIADYLG